MEKIVLNTELREAVGKSVSKKLRKQDIIPAVVYKQGQKTISLQVKATELIHILHTAAGENAIITLKFAPPSKDTKTVLIKDIQYHPIKDDIMHVDFQEISLTEKIKVGVPIVLKGEATGVKADGGILEHITRELQIECLPTQIPQRIELNVEAMKIGDIIHVKELEVPPEIKILTDLQQAVVSVLQPKAEEEVIAPAEEIVASAEEAVEPEVISEKKAEERRAEKAAETETKEGQKKEEQKPEQKGK